MRTRTTRRATGTPALIERMEERCLLSAAFANGTSNAMAYDASGRLWVAYYDTVAKNLKYSLRNADGTWAVSGALLDAGVPGPNGEPASVGQESVSMVIERGGFPGVAYADNTNADLRYAHFNGTSWDVETIEDRYTTGQYASIAFNPANNRPAISYYYSKAGDLRLRQFNGTDWGGPADYQLIDGQTTDVGRYSILALDRVGWWTVGYDDTTNGAAKYAYQRSGGVWTSRTVDAAPQSDVAFTSIAFDSNNRPALAYYDSFAADLKFARGADSAGTSWGVNTPTSNNTVGKYATLLYDAPTDKFTVYYNYEAGGTTRIKYMTGNLNAWPGTAQTLYTGGGSESRIVRTPGVAGGMTYTWSGADAAGAATLFVNDTTAATAWRQETASAGFGSRILNAGSAVHEYNGQQKIYAIGGNQPDGGGVDYYGNTNAVRASADGGVTWTSWTPQAVGGGAAFSPRGGLTAVSFLGKLWVIAGQQAGGLTRDAWSSADGGATWTREADLPAAFGTRAYVSSAVSEDGSTLYLIGGQEGTGTYPADVWATTDGVTWTRPSAAAPFGGRLKASAAFFKGRLWYMGGLIDGGIDDNSVWSSGDGGVTWTESVAADPTAEFTNRSGHQTVVHDGRMWVLGGIYANPSSGLDSNRDDAWYSFDGINWTQAVQTPVLGGRRAFNAVSSGGRLVVLFGDTYPYNGKNDVWSTT